MGPRGIGFNAGGTELRCGFRNELRTDVLYFDVSGAPCEMEAAAGSANFLVLFGAPAAAGDFHSVVEMLTDFDKDVQQFVIDRVEATPAGAGKF